MPWKVAVEMNKVLRPGGHAFIHTHQTAGLHDVPWDFMRFSQDCWPSMFNRFTGFEIVRTGMSGFTYTVPREFTPRHLGFETWGGFEGSTVIVKKTGSSEVDWPVPLETVLDTNYPDDPS